MLLAREDGSLVRHSLSEGRARVLLEPGLYDVSGDAFLVPIGSPVRGSPDGRWLLVPTPDQGTWLVSPDGETRRRIAPERLTATWAPDSRRIVFRREVGAQTSARDREVYVQGIIHEGEPRLLSRLPEPISYPTWSTGCGGEEQQRIAVISGEVYTHTVWLLDAASGGRRALGRFVPAPAMGHPSMIRWSPNCGEVWVHSYDGYLAFPVDGSDPRPLLMRSPTLSPDGELRAEIIREPETGSARLVVAQADGGARLTYDLPFEQPEDVAWTADGRRILVESYTGNGYDLWMIDPAVGDPVQVAADVTFLGTLADIQRQNTEVVSHALMLPTLPPPGPPDPWTAHDVPDLRVRLRVPPAWRFEINETGGPPQVTLTNFEVEGAQGGASLTEDHIEIRFTLVPSPRTESASEWLSRTRELERNYLQVEEAALGRRPAARIRPLVTPCSEEWRILLDGAELRIHRRPASSAWDAVFDRILDSLVITDS